MSITNLPHARNWAQESGKDTVPAIRGHIPGKVVKTTLLTSLNTIVLTVAMKCMKQEKEIFLLRNLGLVTY